MAPKADTQQLPGKLLGEEADSCSEKWRWSGKEITYFNFYLDSRMEYYAQASICGTSWSVITSYDFGKSLAAHLKMKQWFHTQARNRRQSLFCTSALAVVKKAQNTSILKLLREDPKPAKSGAFSFLAVRDLQTLLWLASKVAEIQRHSQ